MNEGTHRQTLVLSCTMRNYNNTTAESQYREESPVEGGTSFSAAVQAFIGVYNWENGLDGLSRFLGWRSDIEYFSDRGGAKLNHQFDLALARCHLRNIARFHLGVGLHYRYWPAYQFYNQSSDQPAQHRPPNTTSDQFANISIYW